MEDHFNINESCVRSLTNVAISKTVPTFYFIGVTTTKSSIMKVFPLWMKVLGRPEVVIEGMV